MQKLLRDYGMLLVLLLLCGLFSLLTLKERRRTGAAAVREIADRLDNDVARDRRVVIAASGKPEWQGAVDALAETLAARGYAKVSVSVGSPRELRGTLDGVRDAGEKPAAIVVVGDAEDWLVWERLPEIYPAFGPVPVVTPSTYYWPDFLGASNLLAVVDRIVVIAVIAVGMTMVIITAGIDLSVGSLIALSGVVGTLVMKRLGGLNAAAWTVPVGFAAGIACCGLLGGLGGVVVARAKVAPFIVTLALMLVARGLAREITGDYSIYQVPKTLTWLGQGRTAGIPNTVILLAVLYVVAHVFMTHTRMGRYIYAVGGNPEAARLSGVPVRRVLVFVYVASAAMAGLGGCIQASQINTGTPNCGKMYELYVIAAVVVGGTSLSGGSGKILGTLIGAFIISVIQNGMNLLGIRDSMQMIVLGAVILGAVLLDELRGRNPFASLGRWP